MWLNRYGSLQINSRKLLSDFSLAPSILPCVAVLEFEPVKFHLTTSVTIAALGNLSVFKDYDDNALTGLGGNIIAARGMIGLLNLFPKRINVFDLESLLKTISPLVDKPVVEIKSILKFNSYQLETMQAKYWSVLRRMLPNEQIGDPYLKQRMFSQVLVERLQKQNLQKTSKYIEWEASCADGSFVLFTCPYTDKSSSQAGAVPFAMGGIKTEIGNPMKLGTGHSLLSHH